MDRKPIVVIDGPAGSGKSTVSRLLAARLGYLYLDTGALYRTVAYLAGRFGIREEDEAALVELLRGADIRVRQSVTDMRVEVGGEDVTAYLREEEVGIRASRISALPGVREMLLPVQRAAGVNGGIVAEGRDVGTVVFPDAAVKFYLDADEEERIASRFREVAAGGGKPKEGKVAEDLRRRDRQDKERRAAPLRPHEKAIIIDTTNMSIPQVVEVMLAHIKK